SSAPPITGIRMSVSMASKRCAFTRSSASVPEVAMDTSSPSSEMISARFSANSLLSSTSRYRRMAGGLSQSGEQDAEGRAPALACLVGDGALVPLDDALHQREP